MYKIFISALVACFLAMVLSCDAGALEADKVCARVESVFARGSGQELNNKEEFGQFIDQVGYRVKGQNVDINFYELGTESYGGALYPAEAIGWNHPIVSSGAWLSAGEGFKYGASVDKGKKEFKAYIDKRIEKCGDDSVFVVGGYSQGAQVVREGVEMLSTANKNKIVYIALFGDPKLHLPEGFGIFADACRGKNLSLWRKDVPECHTYAGALEAQRPFVSSSLASKTGLWCNRHDYICGSSSIVWDQDGHGKYAESGQAIDKAAKEIAKRVKAKLPVEQARAINTEVKPGDGTVGHDVAFVVDRHVSMEARFPQIKQYIRKVAEEIAPKNGRIGIMFFGADSPVRDQNGEIVPGQDQRSLARVHGMHFDYPLQTKLAIIDGIYADLPGRGSLLHAMQGVLDVLAWRQGAIKSTIIFTDDPTPPDPDYNDNTGVAILKRALEIDPVSIFPVVPEENKEAYAELANKSSGRVFELPRAEDPIQDEISQAILNRPVVLFALSEYSAEAGQAITFDVSESYVLDSEIVKYEWDFEGDLAFEKTTAIPTVDHTYTTNGERIVQVRLTAANGMIANGSAVVKIGQREAPAIAAAPQNLTVIQTPDDPASATLTWRAADALAAYWAVSLNGVNLGLLTADRTSIKITDLERGEDITFGVAGVTNEGSIGNAATTVLAKPAPVNPNPDPTSPCSTGNFLKDLICKATAWYREFILRITQWKPAFPWL